MKHPNPTRETPFAPAIVMIHGDFGDGFESWGLPCDQIGRRYRTIIADRPGFGAPLAPGERFSIAAEASELFRMTDQMGQESFHLAGHSYGALIALEMAIAEPAHLRSLHLIEPPLFDLLPRDPLVQEMDLRVRSILGKHRQVGDEATTEAFFAMIGAEHVPERLRGTPEWQRLTGYADRFAQSEPAGDYKSAAVDHLAATIPVGLYTGGRSHVALRAVTQELARRIARSRVTDVPAAGHAVQMAGEVFLTPLLGLVAEADLAWEQRVSAAADAARK